MLYETTCEACKGAGKLEYEEEMGFDGTWRRRSGGTKLDSQIWPMLVEQRPDAARYQTDTCEVCHGDKVYTVESVPCKIF